MLSYWETTHFIAYDVIIIGAGIVGLSTAASIAEKHPHKKILVLERGLLPTGASTKNAGFACFGSLTELLADLRSTPETAVLELVQERYLGLLALRQRLGDDNIAYEGLGGYELLGEKELYALDELQRINHWLKAIFPKDVFVLENDQIENFGFNTQKVKALVRNTFEGQIDTGKMMQSLWDYVQQKGVRILTGCEVVAWEENPQTITVKVQNQTTKTHIDFTAQQLVVCTNAFTTQLLPKLDIRAGRGQVLITEPLKNLRLKGAFHYDEGFFYFRHVGQRILLGGGRNLDFEGETSTELLTTKPIINYLEELLKDVICPYEPVAIAQQWAGIMAFGATKQPIVQWHSPKVLLGVRCGGMGVALGSRLGEKLAEMLLEKN
jgi:glycine/D-amino acid oxidase-like deaminating enzyme